MTSNCMRTALSTSLRPLPRSPLVVNARRLRRAPQFSTFSRAQAGSQSGFLGSLLHGSAEAKAEHEVINQSHSASVARGKFVHHIIKHRVYPSKVEEYREAIAQYYPAMEKTGTGVHHVGSFEVAVGEMDTFIHILEFPGGYSGFDAIKPAMNKTQVHHDFLQNCLPLIASRETILGQEFAFWPTAPPKELGGIYELRVYNLKPGSLLEWEHEWRQGLLARRHHHEPIAAYFSQLGQLHQVMHIWHYKDLASRDLSRQKMWGISGWAQTVSKTVKLTQEMKALILEPLPFSPIR